MRKYLAILVLATTFVFVAYMDSPEDAVGFESVFHEETVGNEKSTDAAVSVQGVEEDGVESFYDFVQEDIDISNGEVIETYREYEFFEGDGGQIIKKTPTENYNYLRYKIENE